MSSKLNRSRKKFIPKVIEVSIVKDNQKYHEKWELEDNITYGDILMVQYKLKEYKVKKSEY